MIKIGSIRLRDKLLKEEDEEEEEEEEIDSDVLELENWLQFGFFE